MNKDLLYKVHILRLRSHGYTKEQAERSPWPKTAADWRKTPHGAPWDANVHMAEWHLDFYAKLKTLLEG